MLSHQFIIVGTDIFLPLNLSLEINCKLISSGCYNYTIEINCARAIEMRTASKIFKMQQLNDSTNKLCLQCFPQLRLDEYACGSGV